MFRVGPFGSKTGEEQGAILALLPVLNILREEQTRNALSSKTSLSGCSYSIHIDIHLSVASSFPF